MRMSQEALDRIETLIEGLENTSAEAGSQDEKEDRQLAVDLRTLLEIYHANLEGTNY